MGISVKKIIGWIVAIVLMLFLFLVFSAALVNLTPYGDDDWMRFSETITGTVLVVEEEEKADDIGWTTYYTPTYTYTVDGEIYTVVGKSTSTEYAEGDPIEVYYDPSKPEESVVWLPEDPEDAYYLLKFTFLWILLPIALFGVAVYLMDRASKNKNKQNDNYNPYEGNGGWY